MRPTLDRFPDDGLGVAGPSSNRLVAVLAPNEVDPNEDLLAPPIPPAIAFCSKGLAGEYGDPPSLLSEAGLPLPDIGELLLLAGDPAREGVREYRGGVL